VSEHESGDYERCAFCARTILRGERLWEYATPAGDERGVCTLCKPRAEAGGWVPAELAGTLPRSAQARRPRGAALRELLTRAQQRRREAAEPAAPEPEPEPEPQRRDPRPLAERAIDAFNNSHERRKVAGLRRSLGEPSVSVRRREASGDVALVTVAWELSWYQWEVQVSGAGERIEVIGQGDEISELPEGEQEWNAGADEEGRLKLEAT
jgi:hypothetical protein